MNEYKGSLNHRKKLPKDVSKAYRSVKNQLTRCRNKNIYAYKTYGSMGIKVEYTIRQFVFWYLKEIKKYNYKFPVVGRIDHSKNYSFDNIEIQERSDNSKEAMARTAHRFSHKVLVIERLTNKIVDTCESLKSASVRYGNSFSCVHRIANNMVKNPRTKYIYRKVY